MVPATAVMTTLRDRPGVRRHGLDLLRATGLPSGRLYPTLVRLHRADLVDAVWQDGRRSYRASAGMQDLAPGAQILPVRVSEQKKIDGKTQSDRDLGFDAGKNPADQKLADGRPAAHKPGVRAPHREPATAWLPAILVAVATAGAALDRSPADRLPDLHVYLGAVDALSHGTSLYDFIRGDAPFTYPPFAGLLFWPLTWAPTLALQIGWTLATVATVVWLARATTNRHPAMLALVLTLSAPFASNLRYGQVSLFLAAMVTLDVLRPSRAQGVLIGLAAAIKLTPLIFIPMLWVTGRRAAAVTATATFAGCGVLAAAVLPGDSRRFWTTEMFHVSRLGDITSAGNQSLNGALLRLDAPLRSAIVLIIGGMIATLALRRAARLGPTEALIVVGAASIVLSPVSWTHHQIWLVLAVLCMTKPWRAVVLVVMLLPVTALGGPLWSNARLILATLVAAVIPVRPADRADRPQACSGGRGSAGTVTTAGSSP